MSQDSVILGRPGGPEDIKLGSPVITYMWELGHQKGVQGTFQGTSYMLVAFISNLLVISWRMPPNSYDELCIWGLMTQRFFIPSTKISVPVKCTWVGLSRLSRFISQHTRRSRLPGGPGTSPEIIGKPRQATCGTWSCLAKQGAPAQ